MEEISDKRFSDYIAQQIADEILSGRMEGGGKLRQEELADSLGASRIPVREALQILESQGLVIRLATKRILSVELDPEKIREIYEAICDMEKRAVKNLQKTNRLSQLVQEAESAKREDVLFFHKALYRLTDNVYLSNLLKNAAECYIRFALSIDRKAKDIAESQDQLLHDIKSGGRIEISSAFDAYYALLTDNVNEERRYNQ